MSLALISTPLFRKCSASLMGLLYLLAGLNHFWNPSIYEQIMPDWLPSPPFLVALSGVIEAILGGLLLITSIWPLTKNTSHTIKRLQRLSAWGIIALLIAVFPANINMSLHPELTPQIPPVLLWLRLPVQWLLIRWAYLFTQKDGPCSQSDV